MSSKSRKRRRRLIKYGAIALGTIGAAYGLGKLFGGGGGEEPATASNTGETTDTAAGDAPPLEAPTMAGMNQKTILLIGAAVLLVYFISKKR